MADTSFCLCRHSTNTVHGIALGATTDDLVLTIQDDGVVQYSVSAQAPRSSWGLGSADLSFRSAAVYNTAAESYHAAVRQQSSGADLLLSWSASPSSATLEKDAARTALPKAVHAIHPVTCDPSERESRPSRTGCEVPVDSTPSTSGRSDCVGGVFIVFADGTVGLDSFYKKGRKQHSIGQEGRVLATSSRWGQLAVVTLEGGLSFVLAIYETEDGQLRQAGTALLHAREGATLASISIRGKVLSVLWAEGTLQTFKVSSSAGGILKMRLQASRRLIGGFASAKAMPLKLRNGQKNGLMGKRKSLITAAAKAGVMPVAVGAPENLVATVSCSGGEEPSKLRVTVLDGLFGSVRHTESIAGPSGLKMQTAALQAVALEGHQRQLAIVAGSSVLITHIEDRLAPLATLVGALARLSNINPLAQVARAALSPDNWKPAQPRIKRPGRPRWYPRWGTIEDTAWRDPAAYAKDVAVPMEPRDNGGAAPGPSSEELGCRRLHADIESHATYLHGPSCAKVVKRAINAIGAGRSPLPHATAGLLMTRLAEKGLWGEMEQVLRHRPLRSLAVVPGFATRLAEDRRHQELALLLAQAKGVPLSELSTLLRALLLTKRRDAKDWHTSLRQAAANAIDRAEAGRTAGVKRNERVVLEAASAVAVVEGFAPQDLVLHPLLAMKVDRQVLLAALRKLPVNQALRLARYLKIWISHYSDLLPFPGGTVLHSGAVVPPLAHVLHWTARLLDIHLIGLAMLQGAPKVLRDLQRAVQEQLTTVQRMARLMGPLEHIGCRARLPKRHPVIATMYDVEVVDLRSCSWELMPSSPLAGI